MGELNEERILNWLSLLHYDNSIHIAKWMCDASWEEVPLRCVAAPDRGFISVEKSEVQ